MKIIAMEADEHVSRRICMRVTRGYGGVGWEIAFSEARESNIIRKSLTEVSVWVFVEDSWALLAAVWCKLWSRITVPVSERAISYSESEAEFITGFGTVCET